MRRAALLVALAALAALPAQAQLPPPSPRVGADTTWLPSPRGALLRSLAVPGWGQVYNGQPLKAPVVVGGLGALGYVVARSERRAVLFRRAALFDDCANRPAAVPGGFCEGFERYEGAFARADALTPGQLEAGGARTIRNAYRRQRDLFALVTVLAYGLQALDAYVAAELADFDVGEDLSLRPGVTPQGPALTLRWEF